MKFAGVVVAALVLAAGCSTMAPAAAPVSGAVVQNPTFSGDSLVFSMRVENISRAALDLTFPSSCDVLPYFTDARTHQQVTPAAGEYACAAVMVYRTLQPGEDSLRTVTVKAGTAPDGSFAVLPAGDYSIHARLVDSQFKMQSGPLAFSLR